MIKVTIGTCILFGFAAFGIVGIAPNQDVGQTRENPVRVGGDVPPPKRVTTVAPVYPDDAKTGR